MRKRILMAGLSLASMACMFASSAVASAPSGSKTWSGSVNFWVSKVGQEVKSNTSNQTYMSFTGAPYSMNVWLTQQTANTEAAPISDKTKFSVGDEITQITSAIKGQKVDITAAREYILDEKVFLSGKWKP